jgi:hypothetical protein
MKQHEKNQLEKAITLLNDAMSIVENIAKEKRDAYDRLYDRLQQSNEVDEMIDFALSMDDVAIEIENAMGSIQNIIYK